MNLIFYKKDMLIIIFVLLVILCLTIEGHEKWFYE